MRTALRSTVIAISLTCAIGATAQSPTTRDETVVRTAYAKLAHGVQVKTVYNAVLKNRELSPLDLNKQIQENELRFDISEMTSGPLTDITDKPNSDFVSVPDGNDILSIASDTETFDENGKRAESLLAGIPQWVHREAVSPEGWDMPVGKALELAEHAGKFSSYVALTATVRFQGKSRTYRSLWLFGTETLAVDLVVTGINLLDLTTHNTYPSVLADTSLRSTPAVHEWLTANQRFEASCKVGKSETCCDPTTMRCGIAAEDLGSKVPAPTTKTTPKGGL